MDTLIQSWLQAPWYIQLLNFAFLVISFGLVIFAVKGLLAVIRKSGGIKIGNFIIFGNKIKKPTKQPPTDTITQTPTTPVIQEPQAEIVRPSLLKHRVFKDFAYFRSQAYVLPMNSAKECINAAFLKDCKVKVFDEELKKFISNIEDSDGDGLHTFVEEISRILDLYTKESKTLEIHIGPNKTITGVPKSYMAIFDKWHQPHAEICIQGIANVLDSSYYEDWWTQAVVCLDIIDLAFKLTFSDAEKTLAELNGQLDKEIKEMLIG